MLGWSINLTLTGVEHTQWIDLPVARPLYVAKADGHPVVELVVWSDLLALWVHMVGSHFYRELPDNHVQVAVGDLYWIRQVQQTHGPAALSLCAFDLQHSMEPSFDES